MNDPLGLFETEDQADPLGLFSAKEKTSLKEDLKLGVAQVGNTADTAWSMLAGALARPFDETESDRIFSEMERRRKQRLDWANPEGKEQNLAGKVTSAVGTLPMQLLTFPLSPFETGKTAVDAGESTGRAIAAQGIDTVGNMVGVALPAAIGGKLSTRMATGAGINAAQDVATRAGMEAVVQTPEAKEALGPSVDSAVVSGVVGTAVGAATRGMGPQPTTKPKTPLDKLNKLKAIKPKPEPEPAAPAPRPVGQQELDMFGPDQTRVGLSPYQVSEGQMRVGPDGVPYRDDLSQEVGRTERVGGDTPDLFETAPSLGQLDMDAAALKRQQMDDMWNQRAQEVQAFGNNEVRQLRNQERIAEILLQAYEQMEERLRSQAYKPTGGGQGPKTRSVNMSKGLGRRQGGVIDTDVFLKDFPSFVNSAIKTATGALKPLFRGVKTNYEGEERPMMGKIGPGVYLTESTTMSGQYAVSDGGTGEGHIRSFYVNAQNPYVIDSLDNEKLNQLNKMTLQEKNNFVEKLKAQGYDSIVVEGSNGRINEINVFDPENVKNAYSTPSTLSQGIGRSQRGGIDFAAITDIFKQRKADELTGLKGRIPADPSAESVIEAARGEQARNANRLFAAGASLESVKTGSTVIRAVENIVQNWGKRAEQFTRNSIFPVEKDIRALSTKEKIELSLALQQEFREGTKYTPEDLMKAGYSERQALAYQSIRNLFNQTLTAQNEARAARGQKPISAQEAYYSSMWQGDFGVKIVDEDGATKWVVRANTKLGAERQAKAVLAQFPELKRGDSFDKLGSRFKDETALQSAYTTMLDILGRNDPTVIAIKQLLEQQGMQQAENTLAQTEHFKDKQGTRGYLGDTITKSPAANANDFFKAQIQYAKNAFKWAEVQKASENLNKILTDPELNESQPKNIQWAKDYVARDLGFGELQEIRALENALGRATGVSPTAVANAVGQMKFLWITQKLALSPGYIASNAFQLANTMPWHTDLSQKGFTHNPATTVATSFVYGLNLANYHYLKYTSWNNLSQFLKTTKMLPEHAVGAMEYAEANGVTNRSVYDEAGIDPNRTMQAIQQSVAVPETYARSMAYMSFVQHLFDSGQFPKERWQEMYQLAERYTNMAMGDARQSERAPIFAKAGLTGNMFNTLQTYTVNWFNQYAYFSREAMKGNPLPLFVGLATTAALGGMMGLPLVQDIHNIWEWFKKQLPSNLWNKVKDWDIKMAMMDALGESGTYGVLSDATGVNWSTRLASPQLLEAPTMPGGMVTDIAEQGVNWLSAGISVDDATKWHQAAISSAPPGLKELYAQSFAKAYTQSDTLPNGQTGIFSRKDIGNREAVIKRDQNQQDIAKWGVRSQKEVVEGDLNNFRRTQELQMRERRTKQVDKIYRNIRTKGVEDVSDDIKLYIALGGDNNGLIQGLERKVQNEFLSREERGALSAVDNIEQAKMLIKLKKLKEELGYAN